MHTDFRITSLRRELFEHLFGLADDALAARGVRRVIADEDPGYPCRVSLRDAAVGEAVLLLAFEHHRVDTPHRGSGPIYVREGARRAEPAVNEVPPVVRSRLLSLRGFDRDGMLVSADVVAGREFEAGVAKIFGAAGVEYIHIHNAKPGCFSCRVDRAQSARA